MIHLLDRTRATVDAVLAAAVVDRVAAQSNSVVAVVVGVVAVAAAAIAVEYSAEGITKSIRYFSSRPDSMNLSKTNHLPLASSDLSMQVEAVVACPYHH
jgi:hypothetical protein